MERRDFLRAGALATGGTLGLNATGCGGLLTGVEASHRPALDAGGVSRFLKGIDSALHFIDNSVTLNTALERQGPPVYLSDQRFAKSEDVIRKSMRSLLVASAFKDLPERARAHPDVQALMRKALPEMNDAVTGMRDALGSLTPTERADIGRAIKQRPELPSRFIHMLDQEAEHAGLSPSTRSRLADVGKHATLRLRQSVPFFIEEYSRKVKKVERRVGSVEASQRRLAATIGAKAFWAYQTRQADYVRAWAADADAAGGAGLREPVAAVPDTSGSGGPAGEPAPAKESKTGSGLLLAGGIVLGVSALMVIPGVVLIVVAPSAGLVTLGGILLIAGGVLLLTGAGLMIAGAVVNANQ